MKCAHLFNGIGGFALAAHWMGWENYMHCEIDSFCNRVMNYHFPNSIQHENIRKTDFTGYRGTIDLLTGGFPCQPFSNAGKRLGKEDERHLWPEMLRAIRQIQPGWVVGENVRGLTNWNGGMVFNEVQTNLEAEGYEVLPFLLPAAGVNAPHRRDRIWFIAYSVSNGYGRHFGFDQTGSKAKTPKGKEQRQERDEIQRQWNGGDIGRTSAEAASADASSKGFSVGIQSGEYKTDAASETQQRSEFARTFPTPNWDQFPTQSPVRNGNDGIPDKLAGITVPKWRAECLKAMGNAVVPELVLQIFKAIEQYNNEPTTDNH